MLALNSLTVSAYCTYIQITLSLDKTTFSEVQNTHEKQMTQLALTIHMLASMQVQNEYCIIWKWQPQLQYVQQVRTVHNCTKH